MSAVATEVASRTKQPFGLQAETIEHLNKLASEFGMIPSRLLERYIALAHGEVVLGEPCDNRAFAPWLRQLAARRDHFSNRDDGVLTTSFVLDARHVEAIRELRDGLKLPRRDLVVEYVVQAAWATMRPDGGSDGGSEDPLERSRRASRHNVERSTLAPATPTPLLGQRRLFSEEDDSEG